MDFISACRKMISYDTSPAGSTCDMVKWLAEYCKTVGLQVETIEESFSGKEQSNILVFPQQIGEQQKQFLLQTHLDTPDCVSYSLWTKNHFNPFDAIIEDGFIYGLGAANAKLDFLCKVEALKTYAHHSHFKKTPLLLGTFGEETGMYGMLRLIRKNKLKNVECALIGEPTGLKLIGAGKGIAIVEINIAFSDEEKNYRNEHDLRESTTTQSRLFVGKPNHSSVDSATQESAILKLFEYLKQLPSGVALMEINGGVSHNTIPSDAYIELDLVGDIETPMAEKIKKIFQSIVDLEEEFKKYQDQDFEPPYATLNVGVIKTTQEGVQIQGSCRIPPVVTDDIYQNWITRLQMDCTEVGAECRVTDYKKPYRTNKESSFVKKLKELQLQLNLSDSVLTQSNLNEASLLHRIGIECISFGPGQREGNINTPFEKVSVAELHQSINYYTKIIKEMCL